MLHRVELNVDGVRPTSQGPLSISTDMPIRPSQLENPVPAVPAGAACSPERAPPYEAGTVNNEIAFRTFAGKELNEIWESAQEAHRAGQERSRRVTARLRRRRLAGGGGYSF